MQKFTKVSDIKVGVVGYGGAFNMGKAHLEQMRQAGMTPAAVAEIDPQRLITAAADFPGIACFPSLGALLKQSDCNLLAIITPHNTHARLAIQALKDGRNVVCEKPFAITTTECDAMIRAARARRVMLSTYHNRHWDGCVMEAVKRIGAGALGDLVRVEVHMGGWGKPGDWWRTSRSISGGILYDWGVHLLEYCLQIIGSDLVEVSGFAHNGFWGPQTKWGKDANEDDATAVARFKNGVMLTLHISQIESNPKRGIVEFTGTRGTYVMDHGTFELITHKGGETITTHGKNPPAEGQRFYQNVADHLVKGASLTITPEWARRPIHLIDLAVRSAKANRTLRAVYG